MPTESLLRISDAASLGLHAMAYLAGTRPSDRPVPTAEIASRLQVSESHLRKVLQRLSHAGLIRSKRGPGGGLRLARPAEDITLLEIHEAVAGRLPPGVCLLGRPRCLQEDCLLGDLLRQIHSKVRRHFAETRLSDFRLKL